MRPAPLAIGLLVISVSALATEKDGRHYKVVDEDGNTYYGDSIPPELSDDELVGDHGVTVGEIEGRKTADELEAQRRAEEQRLQKELQQRANQALLATYQDVAEIQDHCQRRIQLFQAQSRVTELYLDNLVEQLADLEHEAAHYDDAETTHPSLFAEIQETKDTIARHEMNLKKLKEVEGKPPQCAEPAR
jgi:hypothetical protein